MRRKVEVFAEFSDHHKHKLCSCCLLDCSHILSPYHFNQRRHRCHCILEGFLQLCRNKNLEHVFRKFGRCTVRIKGQYGFAVFDASDDAARALRHLHGKFVCGKCITVNWSKHQPDLSCSFRRSSRRIGSSNGRTSRDGVHSFRFSEPADQKNDYTSQGTNLNPFDGVEKKNHHNPDDVAQKSSDEMAEGMKDAGQSIGEDPVEMKMDDGGTSDTNAIEHDRWGETGIGNHGGDDGNFDRFEPYHGYSKQEEKKKIVKADHRRIPEKWKKHCAERFDQNHGISRALPTCYSCGTADHIGGNCPEETVGKFKTLGDGLSLREKEKLRPRKFRYPSTRRQESHVNPMIQAHQRVQHIKPFSDRIGRVSNLSNVPRLNRGHPPQSENMPQIPKEASNGSKLRRSREPSLSSERNSSYSRSRSPCPHSTAQSPSHSAHSSSKSSQPTQAEGFKLGQRSNLSHHGPLSVSVSPQCDSAPASGNRHMDDYKQEAEGSRLNCEVPFTSSKLDTPSNGDLPVPGTDVKVAVQAETNLHEDMVDDLIAYYGEMASPEDTLSVKSNTEHVVKKRSSISLKLTTTEVVSALKHYGVEAREVVLSNEPVESYFGAARLWPWEIIYYRRCKKGPISTENYAERLEQNKEFGIVDQYVRSCSGWWECRLST